MDDVTKLSNSRDHVPGIAIATDKHTCIISVGWIIVESYGWVRLDLDGMSKKGKTKVDKVAQEGGKSHRLHQPQLCTVCECARAVCRWADGSVRQ